MLGNNREAPDVTFFDSVIERKIMWGGMPLEGLLLETRWHFQRACELESISLPFLPMNL